MGILKLNYFARAWLFINIGVLVACSSGRTTYEVDIISINTPTPVPVQLSPTPTIWPTTIGIPTEPLSATAIVVLPTITDLPSVPTVEISLTPSLEPTPIPDLTSRLFTFFAVGGFDYGWQEPLTGQTGKLDPADFGLTPSVIGAAATLSFAHYSNQVAIWSRLPDEPGRLWLADIVLQEARLIYVDNDQIYATNTSFPPQDLTLNWLPNDKYVLVQPTNTEAPKMLIDVATGSYQENWPWQCNRVVSSPETLKLALLCAHDGEFAFLEWDGQFWIDTTLADLETLLEWSSDYMWPFSPSGSIPPWSLDGSKIAFTSADHPDTLIITNSAGENMSVPLDVDLLYPHTIRWTPDKQILVGGYRDDWPASWFIINGETGEIIWRLEDVPEFGLQFTPQQQDELNLLTGEISASGQYLVLASHSVGAGNMLLLIDVKNNSFMGVVADIGHGVNTFTWGR